MTFRFSVIMVCFNEVGGIRETCESICNQTFSNFEWIVIDGGSRDGTLDILNEYRDGITVFVSEPDNGIYHAMNKGIERATGEYLVFMNGGDRFADEHVLESVSAVAKKDVIYGDLCFSEECGKKIYPDILPEDYLLKNVLPHQASFFRRTLFDDFGLLDESYRIAADYEFFVRILKKNKVSYRHISRILAVFDGSGISKDPGHRDLRKRENHRVRWQYFPKYRLSFKSIRQQFRNLLSGS